MLSGLVSLTARRFTSAVIHPPRRNPIYLYGSETNRGFRLRPSQPVAGGPCFCRRTGQPVGAEYPQLARHVSISLVSIPPVCRKGSFGTSYGALQSERYCRSLAGVDNIADGDCLMLTTLKTARTTLSRSERRNDRPDNRRSRQRGGAPLPHFSSNRWSGIDTSVIGRWNHNIFRRRTSSPRRSTLSSFISSGSRSVTMADAPQLRIASRSRARSRSQAPLIACGHVSLDRMLPRRAKSGHAWDNRRNL
jgi:hypothetical protein